MGFVEDIETILREFPTERQTLLFSATVPKPIQNLAQRTWSTQLMRTQSREITVPLTSKSTLSSERDKLNILSRLLDIGRRICYCLR